MRLALLVIACVACAPQIDGPVERQRAIDREDGTRLAAQLAQLPGAVRAEVTLRRPVIDPLTETATTASAAVLVVVDDRSDRAAITRSALALVRGTAPEIGEPAIVVELGAIRPELASVGPFAVDVRDRPRLLATLALGLAAIVVLAAYVAWRERWRVARHTR